MVYLNDHRTMSEAEANDGGTLASYSRFIHDSRNPWTGNSSLLPKQPVNYNYYSEIPYVVAVFALVAFFME